MAMQTLGQVSEGTLVKINENGSPIEFYVSEQDYESALNGSGRVLVVRKDCYDNRVWDNGNVNAYASSDLDSWFNSTYKNMLDADIRSLIGTTKIRYTPGNGKNTVGTLERAIFALSLTELGQSHTYANTEGSALPIASTLRIAYHNGSATTQWTRSPGTGSTNVAWGLYSSGSIGSYYCYYSYGSRPAFTLPSTVYVDDSGNVTVNSAPTAPASITVPDSATKGGSVAVSWAASMDADGNLSGYTLQRSVNGGGFTQVYQGANTSFNDTAPTNADTMQYRVQAYDTMGETSGWTTSDQFPVYGVPKLTVPPMVMQGQSATISWTAIDGADSYTLQRKSSADTDWTQVYSGANLSYSETVGTWTSLQYRVQAVFDETPGDWATSDSIQIVSASALVISGQDGDLGTLTSDVSYSISSDQTSPTIDVTVEVNGGEYASFTATSGETYSIGVLDLPTGTGSIVITASAEVSGSPVSVTRTWTYSKTAASFPSNGSVARLTQEGATVYPETLAEAVRTAMTPWGGNLSTVLDLLSRAALYNRTSQAKYSEVTIDLSTLTQADAQNGKIINLPVNGVMVPHRVVHIGNPDPELYDESCDGVWLVRTNVENSGLWNNTDVNTLPNSTIMQTMAGYVDGYDATVQAAIKTVKIPYCVGNGSATINSGANGLGCKLFPLGGYEIGFTTSDDNSLPVDGAKLDYFNVGGDSARRSIQNGQWYLRSASTTTSIYIFYVMNGNLNQAHAFGANYWYPYAFIMPTAFSATYYVDTQGTIHDQQEYTEAGDWLDVWGNAIPAVKIETGSYVGTGTYGESNPTSLTFGFEPKVVVVMRHDSVSWECFYAISGVLHVSTRHGVSNTDITLSWSDNSVGWYSTVGVNNQLNVSSAIYNYVALG